MRVLGLDPGTRTTGWGLISNASVQLVAEAFGCLRPPRGAPRPQLLARLVADLDALLLERRPDVVVIETPFLGRFARAVIGLAETRGALLAALGRWGGEVIEIEPALVKSLIVGYGRAEKHQVAFVVARELRLAEEPGPDAADALALALCHLRRSTFERLVAAPSSGRF